MALVGSGYGSILLGWINKVTFRITVNVYEVSLTPVSGHVRPHGFSAFQTLEDKRSSLFRRRSFSDCQRLFNSNDVSKELALSCG